MITANLRGNQLSDVATDWYIGTYLDAMDRLDLVAYAAQLADGVRMSFNNEPPVVGKPAVVAMLDGYWRSFTAIEHDLLNIYGTDQAFMLEAMNHYVRLDGRRVSTHAVALTDRDPAGMVTSVRVFADASPVFEA